MWRCFVRDQARVPSVAGAGSSLFRKTEQFFFMERRLLTAQSIDLRRASDPRIERVADRLGRSALIDQRQRDARVSGSLHPMTLSYACVW